jgi:hypothetical protein
MLVVWAVQDVLHAGFSTIYPPGFGECEDHNLGPPRGRWSKRQIGQNLWVNFQERQSGRSNWLTGLWQPGLDSSVRAGGMERWAEWKEMMDGGVSHLSKKVRQRVRGGIGQSRVSTEGAITYFAIHFCFSFPICFCFYWLSYCSTSGASSPEWVQPTAEGGGLFGIYFHVNVLAFRDLSSSLYLSI